MVREKCTPSLYEVKGESPDLRYGGKYEVAGFQE